jgi:hypothetical protein
MVSPISAVATPAKTSAPAATAPRTAARGGASARPDPVAHHARPATSATAPIAATMTARIAGTSPIAPVKKPNPGFGKREV